MSYKQQAKELPVGVISSILQRNGSIKAVVNHITGGKPNEGVRSVISRRVETLGLTGLLRGNITTRYTPEQLIDAFARSICWSDVYRCLGLSVCDHNKASIRRFAEHYKISVPEFSKEQLREAFRRGGKQTRAAEEVYCADSKHPRASLRSRVMRDGVLDYYHCDKCGLQPVWDGEKLQLELDHTNGVSNDNRIENLRWLCPNCHSQTHTYRGKNKQ